MTNKNGILVLDERRRKMISIADIVYIEAFGNYATIHTNTLKFTVARHLLLISELLPDTFIRPHRKFILNQAFIKNINVESKCIEMKNNILIPIARRRLDQFK